MERMNNKSTVGKDATYLTVSKVAVALINVLTAMLLARFRTLGEYGTYSQIIVVTDLVSTILLLGLPNSINYFLAKAQSNDERQKFMSVYLTLSTIMTVVIAGCLYVMMPLIIRYFNNPSITTFAYVFAVYPWSALMINSLSNTCIVYGKANRLIIFNVVQAVMTLSILLISEGLRLSFQQYMVIYMVSFGIFAVYALGWMGQMVGKLKPLLQKELLKEIMIFSIPMGLASVVGTLNIELDKLVIGRFFTTEEYAIFANAAKELPVTILATSLTAVLMPRLVKCLHEKRNETAIDLWKAASAISFWFMTLIVGGFVTFAPDVMSLFYSEKYVTPGGVAVFRIYSLILLLRAVYWGIILNASGKTKFVFYSSIITLVLNLIGNVAACYCLGFIGPAISSLVVIGIMAAVQLGFSSRIVNIGVRYLMPWKTILKYLLQVTVLGIVFGCVRYILFAGLSRGVSIVISIGLGGIWGILYFVVDRKELGNHWKNLNRMEGNIE